MNWRAIFHRIKITLELFYRPGPGLFAYLGNKASWKQVFPSRPPSCPFCLPSLSPSFILQKQYRRQNAFYSILDTDEIFPIIRCPHALESSVIYLSHFLTSFVVHTALKSQRTAGEPPPTTEIHFFIFSSFRIKGTRISRIYHPRLWSCSHPGKFDDHLKIFHHLRPKALESHLTKLICSHFTI